MKTKLIEEFTWTTKNLVKYYLKTKEFMSSRILILNRLIFFKKIFSLKLHTLSLRSCFTFLASTEFHAKNSFIPKEHVDLNAYMIEAFRWRIRTN